MGLKSQEAMEALWDDVEAAPDEAPEAPALAEVEAAPEPVDTSAAEDVPELEAKPSRVRDEAGKFVPAPKAPKQTALALPKAAVRPQATQLEASATPVVPPAVDAAQALKAPTGWKPTAREHWGKLPAEVQAEAIRRDKDAAVATTRAARAEEQLAPWHQALAPYQAMLQASGGHPAQVVTGLLQTAHGLSYGPMPQKAQIIAGLIKSYGVDIKALADAVDGQPQQQMQPQGFNPDALLQQAEARVMQRLQAQRDVTLQQRAAVEMQDFASKHEFFEDVRQEMAHHLQVANAMGRPLTPEQAYRYACNQHPDIAPVMQQREAAKLAAENAVKVQRSRTASSSVRGQPAMGNPNGAEPMSRLEVLSAAWDEAAS